MRWIGIVSRYSGWFWVRWVAIVNVCVWVQWVGVGKVGVGIVSGHSVRVNEMVV